jgi:hypothetical protein
MNFLKLKNITLSLLFSVLVFTFSCKQSEDESDNSGPSSASLDSVCSGKNVSETNGTFTIINTEDEVMYFFFSSPSSSNQWACVQPQDRLKKSFSNESQDKELVTIVAVTRGEWTENGDHQRRMIRREYCLVRLVAGLQLARRKQT